MVKERKTYKFEAAHRSFVYVTHWEIHYSDKLLRFIQLLLLLLFFLQNKKRKKINETYSGFRGVGTGVRFDETESVSFSSSLSLPNGFVEILKRETKIQLFKIQNK